MRLVCPTIARSAAARKRRAVRRWVPGAARAVPESDEGGRANRRSGGRTRERSDRVVRPTATAV